MNDQDKPETCGVPDAIISPMPDELCPHVEMGADMAGGFVFVAENPRIAVGCGVYGNLPSGIYYSRTVQSLQESGTK
jgi:hypothetical protein